MGNIKEDFDNYAPIDCTGDTSCPVCRDWEIQAHGLDGTRGHDKNHPTILQGDFPSGEDTDEYVNPSYSGPWAYTAGEPDTGGEG